MQGNNLLVPKLVLPREPLFAHLALKRLLPGVGDHVAGHVVGTGEFLAADLAGVAVVVNRGTGKNNFRTNEYPTHKKTLPMNFYVAIELGHLLETHLAYGALEHGTLQLFLGFLDAPPSRLLAGLLQGHLKAAVVLPLVPDEPDLLAEGLEAIGQLTSVHVRRGSGRTGDGRGEDGTGFVVRAFHHVPVPLVVATLQGPLQVLGEGDLGAGVTVHVLLEITGMLEHAVAEFTVVFWAAKEIKTQY